MNIGRAASKVVAARGIKAAVSFVAVTLFARLLGASDLGIYYLFEAAVGLLIIIADPGISAALKKRLSEGRSASVMAPTAIALLFCPVTIVLCGLVAFHQPLQSYLSAPIVGWVALGIIVRVGRLVTQAGLEGSLKVERTADVITIGSIVWLLGGSLLIIGGYGVTAAIAARIAGDLLGILWGTMKLLSNPISAVRDIRVSRDATKSLLQYARFAVVSSLGGTTYSWMDVAILGLFVSQAEIGVYETAWRVSMVPLIVGRSIATTVFPQISQWHAKDAQERIEHLIPVALVPGSAVAIAALFGTIALAKPLLEVLFGQEFTMGYLVLIIFTAEKIIQSIHVVLGKALQGTNRADAAAKATVWAIIINVILNFILIPLNGIIGAAIATTISFAVNSALHALYLSQEIKISIPWKTLAWITFSGGVMGGALYLVTIVYPITNAARLFGSVIGSTIIFMSLVVFNHNIRTELINAIKIIQGSENGSKT